MRPHRRAARGDLIARASAAGGPVDVLVNNAGVDLVGAFAETAADDIERLVTLNAIAPAELARQVVPAMIERGAGHIVNVSWLAGCAALPGTAVYSATKAALTHFGSGLRADLEGLPIGTTDVEVGVVPDAEMGESVMAYPPFGDSWAAPEAPRARQQTSDSRDCAGRRSARFSRSCRVATRRS